MHSVDWESIIARAIDNADDKNYVIAGNMVPSKNPKVTRPLLTKLGKNGPESNPFDIQWARTYITPGEPDQPSDMNIDVKDVLHTTQNEYVIAGQARRDFDSPYEGFLFHTDSLGNPIAFMMYRDLHILNSVVQHPNGQGFVAVGQSASTQQDQGFQAAILSVSNDLEPLCYKQVIGAFQDGDYTKFSGMLNKVIEYTFGGYFISVGKVTGINPQNKDGRDTNVLFTSFKENCEIIQKIHYGLPTEVDGDGTTMFNTEIGTSISTNKQTHFITGSVTRCSFSSDSCVYQDVLYIRIKSSNGNLVSAHHYDIQQMSDSGMAIRFRGKTKSVLIAGETKSTGILPPAAAGSTSQDIFLLELKPNGNPKKIELFGTSKTDEFHVDLTLSHNKKTAVMLSNTPLSPICHDATGPWLIERFDNIQNQCRDAPYDVIVKQYDPKQLDVKEIELDVPWEKAELLAQNVEMDQWTMCAKLQL